MGGEANAAAVAGQGPTKLQVVADDQTPGVQGSFRAVSVVRVSGYQFYSVSVGAR
jgi:hypothetical protein